MALDNASTESLLASVKPKANTPESFSAQYGGIAEATGKQLGVDPKLLLAQWGLETGWGKSVVPGTFNLGNIKDVSGGGVAATDNMTGSRDKYRAYESPDAFASDFAGLINRKYKGAVGAGSDATKFLTGLQGYAEDPNYAAKVQAAYKRLTPNPVVALADKALSAVSGTANAATPQNPATASNDELLKSLSNDDLLATLKKVPAANKAGASTPAAKEAGAVTNFVRGAAHGVEQDLVRGPAQFIGEGVQSLIGLIPGIKDTQYWRDIQANAKEQGDTIKQNEAQYQAATPGSVAAGAGRVAANLIGLGGSKAKDVIQKGGEAGKKIVFNLGGGEAAQAGGRLLGASAGSSALGAATGAIAPVTQEGDYGQNKLSQIATGAAVGAALPVAGAAVGGAGRYAGRAARSFVEPFTEAGQNRIAGNLIRRFGEGGPITGNAAELVPGSIPRLSEVTGNAGIGSLELGFSSANPEMKNAIARQIAQNNAARFATLSNLAGSEADRVAALEARSAATRPLYDAATAVNVPVDAELNALLRRPSLQSAVGRAENLAAEQGGTFGLSQPQAASRSITNTITQEARGTPPSGRVQSSVANTQTIPGTPSSIAGEGAARAGTPSRTAATRRTIDIAGNVSLAGEGAPRTMPYVPERTLSSSRTINPYAGVAGEGAAGRRAQEVSGQDLQNLKLAMDAQLLDPTSGIAGREVGAIEDTRNALVNWLRNRIPGFREADLQYAEMSKPIAQMDIGQRLIDKYTTALERLGGDAPPKIKAEAFAQAVLDERKLLKNSKVHEGYKSLEDVFTPEQLRSLQGLADDLARAAQGTNAGKTVGATTFQNLSTNNILENALPGPVRALVGGRSGPVGTAMGAIGNVFYKGANEKIQNRLMEMLMNPQSGLNALQNVGGNQITGPLGSNALLQRLAPNLLPAATVGVGGGLARGK